MTPDWLDLPELRSCDSPRQVLRLPPETDVPLTDRVRSLINTPSFHRLTRISQLGLVATVYPGATHSRWEHSLGVYRLGLQVLRAIGGLEEMDQAITADEAKAFLVAALLHDVGHWPFCHPIEDLRLTGVQPHETMAESLLDGGEFCDLLQQEWQLTPADVANVIHPREGQPRRLIHRLLSGPIDIDKLDYLDRDSLHAGVPYGRHFDRQRLIGAMCRGESLDALAITEKGKT
ncbi:MAG: HD domain-containing protein, partial [Pirellulaceae bacterium]